MSSKTRVSKQVKVTQGKDTITFELTAKSLVIEHTPYDKDTPGILVRRFVLKIPGMDALRELLGLETPLQARATKPVSLPGSDEIERRLTREPTAPDHPPVDDSGLSKPPGEAEAGMD